MEFIVNKYITLKLENNKTVMYVDGEEYNLCCGVLVNLPAEHPRTITGNPQSVDFIVDSDQYKTTWDETIRKKVTPQEEFWAFCSNLQVWAENNYNNNTDLLHYSASLPLLKKLIEVGDPQAEEVFKQELFRKLKYGTYWSTDYICYENYIEDLEITDEELIRGALNPVEADALIKISNRTSLKYVIGASFDGDKIRKRPLYRNLLEPELFFTVNDGHLCELEIELTRRHPQIPEEFKYFSHLHLVNIWITSRNITILPPPFKLENKVVMKLIMHHSVQFDEVSLKVANLEIFQIYSTNHSVKPVRRIQD